MKKLYSIIPAVLIAFSLTACNDGVDPGTNSLPENSISDSGAPVLSGGAISESDIETVKTGYNGESETVYDSKIIDLDFDGENELLVLAGRANTREFDVWEKTGSGMRRVGYFGSGKVNFIDRIELKKAEINGENVYLFSFSYDEGGTMKADEVLSAIKKTADGFEVEYLLSRGTLSYSDIAEPLTKEFYRRGWSKYDIGMDTDYNDITKEEYDGLYKEYTNS